MYTVKIVMGYDDLTFEFENAEVAETFADAAFRGIVRGKNSDGTIKDVSININKYMTTRIEEVEEDGNSKD